METTKEELLKKFEEFIDNHETLVFQHLYEVADVFGFFYAEIEARENQLQELRLALITRDGNLTNKLMSAKISRLESTLEAAEEVLRLCTSPKEGYDNQKYWEARKKYNQLKFTTESEPSSKQEEKHPAEITEPVNEGEKKFKKVDSVTIGQIDEVLKIRSESRISQIIILANDFIPKGNPVLYMHPEDYAEYEKTLRLK